MNATTNRLDNQHTPGFSKVTGNEMKQVEGGGLAEIFKGATTDQPVSIKDWTKVVICGGPNGPL
jgi:hypothetical protein